MTAASKINLGTVCHTFPSFLNSPNGINNRTCPYTLIEVTHCRMANLQGESFIERYRSLSMASILDSLNYSHAVRFVLELFSLNLVQTFALILKHQVAIGRECRYSLAFLATRRIKLYINHICLVSGAI